MLTLGGFDDIWIMSHVQFYIWLLFYLTQVHFLLPQLSNERQKSSKVPNLTSPVGWASSSCL